MRITENDKKLRNFGILLGFLFPFLIGFILPKLMGHHFRNWTLIVGMPLFSLALISPSKLKIPYEIWINIGNFLGFINSRLILGLIFLIVMQPIALIMKIFNYDPLKHKWKNSKSYRELRKNDKIDLDEIF